MENTADTGPKNDQITNDDNSVTNKDGDNDLEQGEPQVDPHEANSDVDRIQTTTPDDNMGDPTPIKEEDEDNSNKGQGPKGENL
ncbi:MAG: hypothetical protein JWR50_2448 [Mucilaginibacter sp.]|nr:hypothetical protein [Mucilaginibacter sp.]